MQVSKDIISEKLVSKNVKVTKRDLLMLKDIYDNCFLSFYQIHEEHFTSCKRPTVYNRLSKLIQAQIICSLNVNLFAHHRNNLAIGVVYQLTKHGVEILKHYLSGVVVHSNLPVLNLSSLYHDLLLIDVLKDLKKKHPSFKIVTTWSNFSNRVGLARIPDAIIFDTESQSKIALELELTAKSDQRYRDIVLSYRTSLEFEKILYVVKDLAVQTKIGGIITGLKSNYQVGDDTDKFKFINLDSLLNITTKGGEK